MMRRFKLVEQDVENYNQKNVSFCSSLKDQINNRAENQNEGTDAAIKFISEDHLQKVTLISEKFVKSANNFVRH